LPDYAGSFVASVVIVDYDPNWPRVFDQLRHNIWSAVSDFALAIEHVGSTAVPGLASKAVVDMDVVVRDDALTTGIARLATLGYVHRGNLDISGREAFYAPAELPRHHLYLCPESSPALWNHLVIRDYLRLNADVAARYGALKKQLARQHANDIDAYIEGKTPFLISILRETGFPDIHITEIERMNIRKR
jgi:GrpB-like predicted nucleotidyltransferase (UPF0157 family)